MTIHLSAEREQMVRSFIQDGRFASEDEVIDEALRLLQERRTLGSGLDFEPREGTLGPHGGSRGQTLRLFFPERGRSGAVPARLRSARRCRILVGRPAVGPRRPGPTVGTE